MSQRLFPTGLSLPLDALYEIALKLPYKDLSSACQTNRAFRSICQSNAFWKDYLDSYYKWNSVSTIYDDGTSIPVTIQPHSAVYGKTNREIAKILDKILILLNKSQISTTVKALSLWPKYLNLLDIEFLIKDNAQNAIWLNAESPNAYYDHRITGYPAVFRIYNEPFVIPMEDKGTTQKFTSRNEDLYIKNLTKSGKLLLSEFLKRVSVSAEYWIPQEGSLYPVRKFLQFDVDRWNDITSDIYYLTVIYGANEIFLSKIIDNVLGFGENILIRDSL